MTEPSTAAVTALALVTLSYLHVAPLLAAHADGRSAATTSLDLGLTTIEVALDERGARLPDGLGVDWADVETIADDDVNCYVVEDGELRRVHFFSELFDRFYSLMPTKRAPTMLISGIPMHRIKDVDPHEDTLRKIKALAPVRGRVLDTATGLGYTAIQAARTAEHVTTVELDPTALEVARRNPWSRGLFDNPKITQVIGDTFDVIAEFDDHAFACVLHDPPLFSLAGELYSGEFYRQVWRVLRRNGRMFHYIGDPNSKMSGNVTRGVVRRLQEAGFQRIVRRPEAFGLVAYK